MIGLGSDIRSLLSFFPVGLAVVLAVGLAVTGCDSSGSSSGPEVPVTTSFVAIGSNSGSVAALHKPALQGAKFTDSEGDTLQIDRVRMFISQIEFDAAEDRDDPEVEPGPFLVDVPMEGGPEVQIESMLPPGKWVGIELELDKRESEDDVSGSFPTETSVEVSGTWSPAGTDSSATFTFTTDVDAEREINFATPLEVSPDSTGNVTVMVNVNDWFRTSSGDLVDPRTAGNDGDNEDLVEENVTSGFEGFEDSDRDGDDDD